MPHTRKRRLAKTRRAAAKNAQQAESRRIQLERQGFQVFTEADVAELKRANRDTNHAR